MYETQTAAPQVSRVKAQMIAAGAPARMKIASLPTAKPKRYPQTGDSVYHCRMDIDNIQTLKAVSVRITIERDPTVVATYGRMSVSSAVQAD